MPRPTLYYKQIAHIKEHLDNFKSLQGHTDVDQYFADYFTKYESFNSLYLGLCGDLGIKFRHDCLFEE